MAVSSWEKGFGNYYFFPCLTEKNVAKKHSLRRATEERVTSESFALFMNITFTTFLRMPPNTTKLSQEEDEAYLEDPREIQARLIAESQVLKKQAFGVLNEDGKRKGFFNFGGEMKWLNILLITVLHISAVYHIITFPYWRHPITVLWGKILQYFIRNMHLSKNFYN